MIHMGVWRFCAWDKFGAGNGFDYLVVEMKCKLIPACDI